GIIETKDKSYLQIKIEKWKNNISIGPNSVMQLNFSDDKKYTLDAGSCRWKSFAHSESKGKIFTKRASMGVRGTDFYLNYAPVLGETEIIMFDGEVMMENINDKTNIALIKKGQWGGIGGRFGEKISPILDLPQAVLDGTEKSLE
ncbi:MAG: FecR domain-containing protein, partial [Bacteriovorax sp.]|nr:FecR domain-containing protein [Bacteriovorax sp.]